MKSSSADEYPALYAEYCDLLDFDPRMRAAWNTACDNVSMSDSFVDYFEFFMFGWNGARTLYTQTKEMESE